MRELMWLLGRGQAKYISISSSHSDDTFDAMVLYRV